MARASVAAARPDGAGRTSGSGPGVGTLHR
jgi:hypothetical protein